MKLTLTCPKCGERPAREFVYAEDVSHYHVVTGIRATGELIIREDHNESDVVENRRLFHSDQDKVGCGEYLSDVPPTVVETLVPFSEYPEEASCHQGEYRELPWGENR